MIADAANDHGFEALIVGDSGHVGPELRLEGIGEIDSFRPFVLKITWTRLLEYECDTVSSLRDLVKISRPIPQR